MDAAFDFLAGPATGAGVVGIGRDRGAGLTADAGVALVVERQEWDAEVGAELPDVAGGPIGEGAELEDGDAGGKGKVGAFFKGGAAAGLLAAEAGKPEFVTGDGTKEGLDLADAAAAIGSGLVEEAELGFLLGDGEGGQEVGEVEVPVGGDAVAIGVGLGKVVAGVEEENGDVRAKLPGEPKEKDVFGLKGAGEAGFVLGSGESSAREECGRGRASLRVRAIDL